MKLTDRITEIEARAAAASTAPWQATTETDEWLICSIGYSQDDGKDWNVTTSGVRASEFDGDAKTDAAFIAAARQDVPELCAKLRRAVDLLVAANTLFGESRSILEAERPDVMHAISAFLSGEGER